MVGLSLKYMEGVIKKAINELLVSVSLNIFRKIS